MVAQDAVGLGNGLVEDKEVRSFRYDPSLLSDTGRYGGAHRALSQTISRKHFCGKNLKEMDGRLRLTVIHECEQAKEWLRHHLGGDVDYWHLRIEDNDRRAAVCRAAASAISQLIECDRAQPYWIRSAFARALVMQAPKGVGFSAEFPDPNHPDGGLNVSIDPTTREHLEPQFLMQAVLRNLGAVLEHARDDLVRSAEVTREPWNWIGNLTIRPPLSRRSKASISRDFDLPLGIATLGLSASLSAWFRCATAGKFPSFRYAGAEMPLFGRPCWNLVADYINLALPSTNVVTSDGLRQQWSTFARGRKIGIHIWARKGIREAQLKRAEAVTD